MIFLIRKIEKKSNGVSAFFNNYLMPQDAETKQMIRTRKHQLNPELKEKADALLKAIPVAELEQKYQLHKQKPNGSPSVIAQAESQHLVLDKYYQEILLYMTEIYTDSKRSYVLFQLHTILRTQLPQQNTQIKQCQQAIPVQVRFHLDDSANGLLGMRRVFCNEPCKQYRIGN